MSIRQFFSSTALIGLLFLTGTGWDRPALAGPTTFVITATTGVSPSTGLYGMSGYLDFQFNPVGTAVAATATIGNFATDGTLVGATTDSGGASGSLPGTVSIANTTGFNDAFQQLTYGSTITFDLTLSVTGSSLDGTTFAFTMYDSNFNTLSTGPSGEAVDVTVYSQNSTPTITGPFGPATGNYPTVTIEPLSPAIPEPSSIVLLGVGLGAVAVVGRFRMRRA